VTVIKVQLVGWLNRLIADTKLASLLVRKFIERKYYEVQV
jgi:hypothetical protein